MISCLFLVFLKCVPYQPCRLCAGPVLCQKCGHKVGLEFEYKQGTRRFGYSLSKDNVMWQCAGENEYRAIKKWSGVPFKIEEELTFPSSRQTET